jgi:hypothetical protein
LDIFNGWEMTNNTFSRREMINNTDGPEQGWSQESNLRGAK